MTDSSPKAPSTEPAVVLRGVTLGYDGNPVISGADLALPAGAVTAFIGPNGAGKSTVLAAIAGLHKPMSGTVTVLGEAPGVIRERIAVVLQSTAISPYLPVSVREVVTMGRYPARGMFARMRASDRAAVDDALARLDIGDLAGRAVQRLSGGQRQRVFVAQGLAQQADVLLLDEPVSGLDLVSQQTIAEVIAAEAAAGRTVVVTTHDLSEAAAAEHLVLLSGEVVASGNADEVLTEANLSKAYGGRLIRLASGGIVVDDGSHHHHHR